MAVVFFCKKVRSQHEYTNINELTIIINLYSFDFMFISILIICFLCNCCFLEENIASTEKISKMSCQRSASRITVPDDLRDILLEFTISYLLEQPGDIIDYAVDFFTRLKENRHNQLVAGGQTGASTPDDSVEDGKFEAHNFTQLISLFKPKIDVKSYFLLITQREFVHH